MTQASFRRLPKKEDPRTNLQLPKDIMEALKAQAKRNGRKLSEEVIARLAITLENNDGIMGSDHLMRLIYCKKLAYKGPIRSGTA